MICIVSQKNLVCLAEAIGKPELATDERYQLGKRALNFEAFIAEIEAFTTQYTVDEAEMLLNEGSVPCSRYNAPADLMTHPQLIAQRTFTEFEDETSTFLVQNAPYRFAGSDISTTPGLPGLGEHTMEVLGSYRSADVLRDLAEKKVIHQLEGAGS